MSLFRVFRRYWTLYVDPVEELYTPLCVLYKNPRISFTTSHITDQCREQKVLAFEKEQTSRQGDGSSSHFVGKIEGRK
jgi:hypothetical protein